MVKFGSIKREAEKASLQHTIEELVRTLDDQVLTEGFLPIMQEIALDQPDLKLPPFTLERLVSLSILKRLSNIQIVLDNIDNLETNYSPRSLRISKQLLERSLAAIPKSSYSSRPWYVAGVEVIQQIVEDGELSDDSIESRDLQQYLEEHALVQRMDEVFLELEQEPETLDLLLKRPGYMLILAIRAIGLDKTLNLLKLSADRGKTLSLSPVDGRRLHWGATMRNWDILERDCLGQFEHISSDRPLPRTGRKSDEPTQTPSSKIHIGDGSPDPSSRYADWRKRQL